MGIRYPFVDKGKLRDFSKRPCVERAGELLNLNRNQLTIMTGLITGHCHLKGRLFKLGPVDSPGCDRCRQNLKRPHMFLVTVKLWRY